MNLERMLFRAWYYLRIGYGTYIAFFIGFASNVIVIYKLAVVDTPLQAVFPHLSTFTIIAVLVAAPLSSLIGLLHMKRTGAYAADASVSTESNPYIFRIIPGKEQEVFLPLSVLTAKALLKLAGNELTLDERREFEAVLSKAEKLSSGHAVGKN